MAAIARAQAAVSRQGAPREVHYLGRVVAADKEGAINKATEEFSIEPARRFRLIAEPVE
jgi:hypothetical protein